MATLCRDCLATSDGPAPARCPRCGSPRRMIHPELFDLAIAHVDADAFYASVEKHDCPNLRDRAVIVGGGHRGVVSTACYMARIAGVRSAMPMYQARRLCPDAIVLRPRMARYVEVSRQIRAMMEDLTPLVEPLSLDEAFLDLSGTRRLHGAPPAVLLAGLARRIETELGLTVSIGLSHNKFLAKIASDIDKPRGFAVIGAADTPDFLAGQSVRIIWGVGEAMQARLDQSGIRRIADLLRWDRRDLHARFGREGARLWHLARGLDDREVRPDAPVRSISNETTLDEDIADRDRLTGHLWRLAEKVTDRAKARGLAGQVVTLKLRRTDFSLLSRSHTLREPSQLADTVFRAAVDLLGHVTEPGPFRLIGVGLSRIGPSGMADRTGDLLDPRAARRAGAERATDSIRARFGPEAIRSGKALR